MHRSGTSAVASALLGAGLSGGAEGKWLDPLPENPAGFAERREIREFDDLALAAMGWTWDTPTAHVERAGPPDPALVAQGRRLVLATFPGPDPWVVKDPRISLLLPLWRRVLMDRMIVVVAVRPLQEVAWSLSMRNGLSLSLSCAVWGAYMRHLATGLDGLPVIVVDYVALSSRPDDVLRQLADRLLELGLDADLDMSSAADAIHPELRRASYPTLAEWDHAAFESLRRLEESWNLGSVTAFERFSLGAVPPAPWEIALLDRHRIVREQEQVLEETRAGLLAVTAERDALAAGNTDLAARLEETRAGLLAVTAERDALAAGNTDLAARLEETRRRVVTVSLSRSRPRLRPRHVLRQLRRAIPLDSWRIPGATLLGFANPLFDSRWYRVQYPDVQGAGVRPYRHFRLHGVAEGRDPNPFFDTDWYLEQNPDVAAAGIDPLDHYLRHGASECRDPSDRFSTLWYLERHLDVLASGINPLLHYLRHGIHEGRSPGPPPPSPEEQVRVPDVTPAVVDEPVRASVVDTVPVVVHDDWREFVRSIQREVVPQLPADAVLAVPGTEDESVDPIGPSAVRLTIAGGSTPGAPGVGISLVAQLESMRSTGATHLVLPKADLWDPMGATLTDHADRHYRSVSEPDGLRVYDLRTLVQPSAEVEGLLSATGQSEMVPPLRVPLSGAVTFITTAVRRVAPPLTLLDAVGVWHGQAGADIVAVRRSPGEASNLPFPDHAFDVLLVPSGTEVRRRVARIATIEVSDADDPRSDALIVPAPGIGARIRSQTNWVVVPLDPAEGSHGSGNLEETLQADQVAARWAGPGDLRSWAGEPDVFAFVEPGVSLLPGSAQHIASMLEADDSLGAVAVKMLSSSGGLESSGVVAFSDGSVAAIAGGPSEVLAPWHDFARDCCWGTGLLAVRGSDIGNLGVELDGPIELAMGSIAARLWAAGRRVRYNPEAVGVRIDPSSPWSDRPRSAPEEWRAVVRSQPARPSHLDPTTWRSVLAAQGSRGIWP
jgi:hypothetical protein